MDEDLHIVWLGRNLENKLEEVTAQLEAKVANLTGELERAGSKEHASDSSGKLEREREGEHTAKDPSSKALAGQDV